MGTVKKYTGQKNIPGLIQKIVNQIPVFSTMIELFAGSAAVSRFLSVSPGKLILNDLDIEVLKKYRIPGSLFLNKNALDLLQSDLIRLASINTFVFIDPPYLHQTRYSQDLYNFELKDDQHEQMLTTILELNCNVMIIHPECDLYNNYLKHWRKIAVKVRYNSKTSVENIYMNYPEPDIIQTFEHLGSDCWDRQRIKRKGDRLIKKLKSLEARERNYLLSRIQTELQTT